MKSVHIGLNKRHFIYMTKSIYFHVLGVLVIFLFLPTEGSVEEHSVELFGLEAHSPGFSSPQVKQESRSGESGRPED